jgi:hypothetical protein
MRFMGEARALYANHIPLIGVTAWGVTKGRQRLFTDRNSACKVRFSSIQPALYESACREFDKVRLLHSSDAAFLAWTTLSLSTLSHKTPRDGAVVDRLRRFLFEMCGAPMAGLLEGCAEAGEEAAEGVFANAGGGQGARGRDVGANQEDEEGAIAFCPHRPGDVLPTLVLLTA